MSSSYMCVLSLVDLLVDREYIPVDFPAHCVLMPAFSTQQRRAKVDELIKEFANDHRPFYISPRTACFYTVNGNKVAGTFPSDKFTNLHLDLLQRLTRFGVRHEEGTRAGPSFPLEITLGSSNTEIVRKRFMKEIVLVQIRIRGEYRVIGRYRLSEPIDPPGPY